MDEENMGESHPKHLKHGQSGIDTCAATVGQDSGSGCVFENGANYK